MTRGRRNRSIGLGCNPHMYKTMFEKTFNAIDKAFAHFEAEMREFWKAPGVKTRHHRIVTKDGHITITGEFKTITVNGKHIDCAKGNIPGQCS